MAEEQKDPIIVDAAILSKNSPTILEPNLSNYSNTNEGAGDGLRAKLSCSSLSVATGMASINIENNDDNDGPTTKRALPRGVTPGSCWGSTSFDHCHRERNEGIDVNARRKLIISSILCLLFMVSEIIGGVFSNSLAVATDAAHLLTDFASFMISLFAIWIAGRPSTQRMSFGWYRAEVIGAIASVMMIWVITGILVWVAIQRIITQDFELDAKIMLLTSGLAIIVNAIMGLQLQHGHSHNHTGGHVHAHTHTCNQSKRSVDTAAAVEAGGISIGDFSMEVEDGSRISTTSSTVAKHFERLKLAGGSTNMNVRAAYIHVLGDVVQSVGVFIAALIVYFKPEWGIADPICTFFFSVIVLVTTFAIMKDALLVLMEGTPSYLHYRDVLALLMGVEGVKRVHNLRIWTLSINKIALSVHLAIAPGADSKMIMQMASDAVHASYNFFETTIQIEDFTPEMENCNQCAVPKH